MIVASGPNDSPSYLGAHLIKPENDQVVLLPSRALLADKVGRQLQEISLLSGGAPLWHVTFNPVRELTDAEWDQVLRIYEAEFSLADVPRAGVEHAKPGGQGNRARHRHYVWATKDYSTGFKLDPWRSKIRDEKVAWLIEHGLGMQPTRRAHTKAVIKLLSEDRPEVARWIAATGFDKGARPVAELNSSEREMMKRTSDDPRDVRAALLAAWLAAGSASPSQLLAALAERGVQLEKGESEGRVLVRSSNGAVQEIGRALNQALKACGLPRIPAGRVNELREQLYLVAYGDALADRMRLRLQPLQKRALRLAEAKTTIRGPQTDKAKAGYKAKRLADLYGVNVDDLPDDIGEVIGYIDGSTIKSRSGALIVDQGKTIHAAPTRGKVLDEDAIQLLVGIAVAKGWKEVTLDGPPEFRAAAARLLEKNGIRVNENKESINVDFHPGRPFTRTGHRRLEREHEPQRRF